MSYEPKRDHDCYCAICGMNTTSQFNNGYIQALNDIENAIKMNKDMIRKD